MEIEIHEVKMRKEHYIVDIETLNMHIIAYLACKDELYDLLSRLPDVYSVLHYLEHLADDVISDMNYHCVLNFLRDHKKTVCRVLIRNQGFYCLEPINYNFLEVE